jgi:hypothetical protein
MRPHTARFAWIGRGRATMVGVTVPLFGDGAPESDSDGAEPVAGAAGEAWAARQYQGWNLRISRNRTVHRVAFLVDERGVEIPAPQCHVGSFAAGRPWWKVYARTSDEVSCGLCLTAHRGHRWVGADGTEPGQLAFDLELPESA